MSGLHAEAVSGFRERACEEVVVLCLNDRNHEVSVNAYKIVVGGGVLCLAGLAANTQLV